MASEPATDEHLERVRLIAHALKSQRLIVRDREAAALEAVLSELEHLRGVEEALRALDKAATEFVAAHGYDAVEYDQWTVDQGPMEEFAEARNAARSALPERSSAHD